MDTPMPQPKTYEEALKICGNTQMAYYILSAVNLGISYDVILRGRFVDFNKGDKHWRIHKALTPINDSVAMSLASYKNVCNSFLRREGFSVPAQRQVKSTAEILEFLQEEHVSAIVVKPTRGFGGMGVTIRPQTRKEIERAFTFAYDSSLSREKSKVLVEEFIAGRHFRMVVLGDKLIAAAERMAPSVVGDGEKTVTQLVDDMNKTYKAKGRPLIKIDAEAEKSLADEQLTPLSVLEKGKRVVVRFNANMTSGGTVRECLTEVHPVYHDLAISVTKEIGLKLAGIDLITPEITRPVERYAINEVNHNPGMRIHYMPDEGEPVDIATPVQQYILDHTV